MQRRQLYGNVWGLRSEEDVNYIWFSCTAKVPYCFRQVLNLLFFPILLALHPVLTYMPSAQSSPRFCQSGKVLFDSPVWNLDRVSASKLFSSVFSKTMFLKVSSAAVTYKYQAPWTFANIDHYTHHFNDVYSNKILRKPLHQSSFSSISSKILHCNLLKFLCVVCWWVTGFVLIACIV